MRQATLFSQPSTLPPGMRHEEELLSAAEESALLAGMQALAFQPAKYKEWNARRRIVSYGGYFDFDSNQLKEAPPLPEFLLSLRERIAAWSGIEAGSFRHALLAEYSAGTPLGWHRDAPCFESIVGVSLAGEARMRLRPYPPPPQGHGQGQQHGHATRVLDLAPRSVYILSGAARSDWQHAISPTRALRYSITFRTLRT